MRNLLRSGLFLLAAALTVYGLVRWRTAAGDRPADHPTEESSSRSPAVRSAAVKSAASGERPPPRSSPMVSGVPLEAAGPEDVRRVREFCRGAEEGDIPDLRRLAFRSPDPLVAGNAIRALGRLGAIAVDPEVIALIRDPRLRVRQEIIVALGQSGSEDGISDDSISELEAVLSNRDGQFRPLALQALGRLGGARARSLLESVRNDPQATDLDRTFARTALRTIEGPAGPPRPRCGSTGGITSEAPSSEAPTSGAHSSSFTRTLR